MKEAPIPSFYRPLCHFALLLQDAAVPIVWSLKRTYIVSKKLALIGKQELTIPFVNVTASPNSPTYARLLTEEAQLPCQLCGRPAKPNMARAME